MLHSLSLNTVCFKNPTLNPITITSIVEERWFRNAFDYNHRVCSDYLLYTVTASGYWNYQK